VPEPELILDPESSKFLNELETLPIPPDARERYDFLCARFAGERVEVREVEPVAGPVPARLYRQGDGRLLVWFHGGRFISGSLETHDALCRRLARALDGSVLAVDYRLAPEHPYPAAFEDARAAASFARSLDLHAASGGDSAGAAVALASGLETVALIYPMVDPGCDTPSHGKYVAGPGPTGEAMRAGWAQFLPAGSVFELPLGHVRRAMVVTAGIDPLRDEGERLAAQLPDCEHVPLKGHIHGFMTYPARFSAVDRVVSRVASFLGDRP
jgi:acetyl esterase